jgi:hypothetical protein
MHDHKVQTFIPIKMEGDFRYTGRASAFFQAPAGLNNVLLVEGVHSSCEQSARLGSRNCTSELPESVQPLEVSQNIGDDRLRDGRREQDKECIADLEKKLLTIVNNLLLESRTLQFLQRADEG